MEGASGGGIVDSPTAEPYHGRDIRWGYDVSPYSIPVIIAFLIDGALVAILLLDDPQGRRHRLLALLISCFALLSAADLLIVNTDNPALMDMAGGVIATTLLYTTAFTLLLSISLGEATAAAQFNRAVPTLILIPPSLLIIPLAFQWYHPVVPHVPQSVGATLYSLDCTGGTWNLVAGIIMAVYLLGASVSLSQQLKHIRAADDRGRRLHLLLGSAAFGTYIAILALGHPPGAASQAIAPRLSLLVISVFLAYVVLGNKVLSLRRRGRHGLGSVLATGAILAFFVALMHMAASSIGDLWKGIGLPGEVLFIVGIAILIRPLLFRVQRLVEQRLQSDIFRYRSRFIQFTRNAARLDGVRELVTAAEQFLRDALSAQEATILLPVENAGMLTGPGPDATAPGSILSREGALFRIMEPGGAMTSIDALMDWATPEVHTFFQRYPGGAAVPLPGEKGTIGILVVAPPPRASGFTLDEEEFLAVFAADVASRIERNLLLERARADEQRTAQLEKLAALGRLTAGVAHEFRNPLSIIGASAQTILRSSCTSSIHAETAGFIRDETVRLGRTVTDLLEFSRPQPPLWEPVDLQALLQRVSERLQERIAGRPITIEVSIASSWNTVTTSSSHLERILFNLGLNAVEALTDSGTVTIAVRPGVRPSAWTIEVRDTGPGIPPDAQKRIFDPFFTTRSEGTGLGLSIVHAAIRTLGGNIGFTSSPAGTVFIIQFPHHGTSL